MGTKVEGDTVKRIRLRNPDGEDRVLYAVSLIEHKSDVDYDVAMQLLHYISNIWRDYARSQRYQTEKGNWVEVNRTKAFRYPPILPIVYYEGNDRWTAGLRLRDRVLTVEGLEAYVPDFTYHLVGIRDYDSAELLNNADEMSLIMLLNKAQTADELHRIFDVPAEEINRIVGGSPEHVLEVILDVVYMLCRKVNLSGEETRGVLSQLKEGRNMGYLFENMEHMDIQEERRKTKEAREELERYKEQTEAELERLRSELQEAMSRQKE
ncbi:MAG: Rpn family recombination-promoting nuclease/putative transposase [bacterium]|nr:Rpn family recombination-promoting nuclease/putative transposase [bacterium]MCM1376046.1 Rpn family recombination-promoting nuclease/putative transposase [Muribaculum sp.]